MIPDNCEHVPVDLLMSRRWTPPFGVCCAGRDAFLPTGDDQAPWGNFILTGGDCDGVERGLGPASWPRIFSKWTAIVGGRIWHVQWSPGRASWRLWCDDDAYTDWTTEAINLSEWRPL